jgi:hypothetical protein
MIAADALREVTVLPGVIHMKASVSASIIMTDPAIVIVDVWCFGVAALVTECAMLFLTGRGFVSLRGTPHGALHWGWAAIGNVTTPDIAFATSGGTAAAPIFMLSQSCKREAERDCEDCGD